jgi:PEP-CTERM motif
MVMHQESDLLSTATVQKAATVRTPPRRMRPPEGKMKSDYIEKLRKEMAKRFERARVPAGKVKRVMTTEEKAEVLFVAFRKLRWTTPATFLGSESLELGGPGEIENLNMPGTWAVSSGTSVPEPASGTLLIAGLVGLAGLALKKTF